MHAELCYRTEISNRCVRSAGYLEEANVLIWGGVGHADNSYWNSPDSSPRTVP